MFARQLKLILSPSPSGLVMYSIATVIVLASSAFSSLVDQFVALSDTPDAPAMLHNYVHDALNSSAQVSILGPATTFLLWASLGAVVYLVVWVLFNIYAAARNDYVIGTKYTSIETHGHVAYWLETAARITVRLAAMLLILILTAVVLSIWYPFSVTVVKTIAAGGAAGTYWLYGLLVVVGWLVVWHLYIVCVRLALLRTRIIS